MARSRDLTGETDPGGANPFWVARVLAVIRRLARTMPRLASDDVWAELDRQADLPPQPEPRAFAAAVRLAERGGLIRVTAETRPTRLRRAHRRPIHVWVSTSLTARSPA